MLFYPVLIAMHLKLSPLSISSELFFLLRVYDDSEVAGFSNAKRGCDIGKVIIRRHVPFSSRQLLISR